MAQLTLEHLRTLTVEDLETLQRLHGDTLSNEEKALIHKVLKEKKEDKGEEESEREEEQTHTQEERENESQEEEGPPHWYKPGPTADEISDSLMAKMAEAERVANAAVSENGDNEEDTDDTKDSQEKNKADGETASGGKEEKDAAPEDEHWFYRGRRKKVKTDA